ncbi:MAG: hypothetical protein LKE81_01005 [Acetobacter sp.]|nr:hypothetical protein [Acetobacter sp.]MCH4060017.1 hypothetical protein [Acetobacter sp.]
MSGVPPCNFAGLYRAAARTPSINIVTIPEIDRIKAFPEQEKAKPERIFRVCLPL